ncbi:MAG: ATP-dependent Clp protease proteolytic subunit [Actinomyces oris]
MSNEMHLPTARYVLPSFIEQSAYGTKETNPYAKLFEERIIFLGTQVDDTSANDIMAQLLVLEGLDPDRDITMYINSPGGSFTSLMAIYDTMQYVRPDVRTVCLGQAASAAAVLLAAGAPGKRAALPNARVLIHQPATEGARGQVSDLEIQAAVVADGPVITSRGMGTAIDFGLEIVRHYLGEEAVDDVKAKIVYQG